jgi:uncharacterized protein
MPSRRVRGALKGAFWCTTLAGGGLVGAAFASLGGGGPLTNAGAGLLVGGLLAAGMPGRFALAFDDRPTSEARALAERVFYACWAGAVASLPLATMAVPLAWLLGARPWDAAVACVGIALAAGFYAVFIRSRSIAIRRIDVQLPELPLAFDGYTIAHLSDVHVGSLFRGSRLAALIRRVNRESPDLAALTGDYVTTGNRFHREVGEALGGLRARDGVLAVLGNHDNFGDREPLLSCFRERDIQVLANSRHSIERVQPDGSRVVLEIVGVDDVYTRRADVDAALADAAKPPLLGLAHDPRLFDALAQRGVALVLSGHTHWGQVGVPFLAERLNLARPIFGDRNVGARRGGSRLIVSPGLGSTGPPVRFGVAPAVLLITLRRRGT